MSESAADAPDAGETPYTLGDLTRYFLWLGTLGFGGPIALVGAMQRDLVDRRRWITLPDFKEGLALAQLAPGPLAAQLAIYLGWLRYGVFGATVVAVAFILPSFLMVLALSVLYLRFGGIPWMQGAFYGIGAAAVIAIIARSAYRLTRSTVGKDRLLLAIFAANAVTTAWTESEIVWVFLGSGVVALAARHAPVALSRTAAVALPWPWLVSGLHGPADEGTLWTLLWYFAEAGAFVFGSGLAIVPFLHGGVVGDFGWLTERQFLDAVAVAMITPGPVVITVAFIGYLVAGPVGATLASLGVFLPCYLLVVIPASYFRQAVHRPDVRAFVEGVTAAAAGAIAGAAYVLGTRAIYDLPSAAIFAATLLAISRLKAASEPVVILVAGVLGVVIASFPLTASPASPQAPSVALVVNTQSGSVSRVDLGSMKEARQYPVGERPYGIAVSRDGNTVAVGVEGEEKVKFFSLPDFTPSGEVRVGPMSNDHIVQTADGRYVLVANFHSDDVVGIDVEARAEAFRIEGASAPHVVKYGPRRELAYVTCKKVTGIAVIDPAKRALVRFHQTNVNPRSLTFSPDESRLYFASFWVDGFFEMDPTAGKVTRLIALPPPAHDAAPREVTYHGVEAIGANVVLAANEGRSYVDAVDVASAKVLDRLHDGVSQPCCVERLPGTDPPRALVSNLGDGSVLLVEVGANGKLTQRGRAVVGKAPKRAAFLPPRRENEAPRSSRSREVSKQATSR